MATVIGSDLPTIAQAVEQQLLTYVSPITGAPVAGDISNIYWVEPRQEPEPAQTGQRDVLLVERTEEFGCFIGGGPVGEWIESGMDVYLRTSLALDPRSTRRQWFIQHHVLINGLMSAMHNPPFGFFPVDANNNALTIEGFVPITNAAPNRLHKPGTWGYTICSFGFHFLPNVGLRLG